MTNTPDEMNAIERIERRLNNAWAKHGFMTLAVSDLRTLFTLARASSRPPADHVPDMVERISEVIYGYLDERFPDGAFPGGKQLFADDHVDAEFKHEAGCDELAERINAALQTVPASREVGELRELLVEAQRHVADLAALPCEAVGPENAESCSCDPCRARSLNERIDFALKASGEE